MGRVVSVLAIALVSAGTALASGQTRARSGGETGSQTPPAGRLRSEPASPNGPAARHRGRQADRPPASGEPRVTSTLRFVPRRDGGTVPQPPHDGAGRMLSGLAGFGPWNGWTPTQTFVVHTPPFPPSADLPPGGLQLDVQPWQAQVYVDGEYAGVVDDFRGYFQHLELPADAHVIAIVAPGYEPLVFDVQIAPGRTTTFRGTLHRAMSR